ncbi:hypothetical protein [Tolypothrix sp. PCC 7601]|uniref:hypothetical protein n=1 Tax=Tolypothrix sp. PCC 7601 TaxID=1188 RepID=UPI0021DFD1E3|nr:hypothetical protein [Tolypothrix sp. PCC 7601]UYD38969.1 hypothetical protein HG267_41515 [Tolypothrix sp. PCC 7601]
MATTTIPDIKFKLPDGTICDLQADMGRLLWDGNHLRVKAFLSKCAKRYNRSNFTIQNAPRKVLIRLAVLVNIYWQCTQTLQILGINWDDKALLVIFAQYGNSSQIPLDGWVKVLAHLNKRWLESDIAF